MIIEADETGEEVLDLTAEGSGADGAADRKAKMVPLSALEAMRTDLSGKLAQAHEEIGKLKAGQQPPKAAEPVKTRFSRAQLRASVERGDITQDQADGIWDSQHEEEILAKAASTANATVSTSVRLGKIQGKIDAYVKDYPDLVAAGSDLRKKVQREFDELVELGDAPDDVATQLKAIRAALGPSKTQTGRRAAPESHEDVGGGPGGNDRPDNTGWAKGLSSAQKKHYEKMITKGQYKGTNDPRLLKEVSLARRAH